MSKEENTKELNDNKALHIGGVMPRFLFGEWILVDKDKSGQIIECYGNSCIVDENGMWTEYQKGRLTKDTRYLTPSEHYELNGA
jgi:hypothetical protein